MSAKRACCSLIPKPESHLSVQLKHINALLCTPMRLIGEPDCQQEEASRRVIEVCWDQSCGRAASTNCKSSFPRAQFLYTTSLASPLPTALRSAGAALFQPLEMLFSSLHLSSRLGLPIELPRTLEIQGFCNIVKQQAEESTLLEIRLSIMVLESKLCGKGENMYIQSLE